MQIERTYYLARQDNTLILTEDVRDDGGLQPLSSLKIPDNDMELAATIMLSWAVPPDMVEELVPDFKCEFLSLGRFDSIRITREEVEDWAASRFKIRAAEIQAWADQLREL